MVEQETRPPEAGSRSDGGGGSGLRHDCRGDRHRLVPLGRYTSHVPGTDGRKDTLALLQKFLTFFKSPEMGFSTRTCRQLQAVCNIFHPADCQDLPRRLRGSPRP